MTKRDILDALAQYEAGQPGRLRELNAQLTTSGTNAAEAIMDISNNPVDEPSQLLYKAAFHGLISRAELIDLTLEPVAGD